MLVSQVLLPDPAKAFGLDTQIGGKMFNGDIIDEIRVLFHQPDISFFRGERKQVHLFSQSAYILHFCDKPAGLFTIGVLFVELIQGGVSNGYGFSIFQQFNKNRAGFPGNKRVVSGYKIPFELKEGSFNFI
jgi:hypothetical protein